MSYNGHLGYLAAVSSQDEFNFVVKVLGARDVWLTSTDIQQKGLWLITAGPDISAPTPVDLWAFGEPFGIGENCAITTAGEGPTITNCDETWFYVVEYECQENSTTECECM
jgi:hypothetical protein